MDDAHTKHAGDGRIERQFARESLQGEQGPHPRMRLTQVHARMGSRFISVWWLLPGVVLACVALVVAFKVLIATGAGQSFIHAHPCVPSRPQIKPGVSA